MATPLPPNVNPRTTNDLVNGFQKNLEYVFVVRVGIAKKGFRVRDQ